MQENTFFLIEIQLSLFFKKPIENQYENFLFINEKMNRIYNDTPTITPQDASLNPNLILAQGKSKSKSDTFQLQKDRLNIFKGTIDENKAINLKDIFQKEIMNIINHYNNENHIYRIGIVTKYFKETDKAVDIIIDSFSIKKIDNPTEVKLRYNDIKQLDAYQINNISEIQNITMNINSKSYNGIYVLRDINNSADNSNEKLSDEFIKDIIALCKTLNNEENLESLVMNYE